MSEFSGVTPANGDSLATLDSDGANEQLTTVAALATLFAGTNLTATNSVIAVDDAFLKNNADDTTSGSIGISGAAKTLTITDTTADATTAGGKMILVANDGAAMQSGSRLGVIEFKGAEDGSSNLTIGARIEATCDAAWTASENGASLEFYTTDANASESKVLTLDSNKLAAFEGEVTGTGFTGTLDGVLGGGTPAAATVTTLASTGVTTIGNGSATVAINSSDWDISTTGTITNAVLAGGTF